MTYLVQYGFKLKQDLNLSISNMIPGINELKTLTMNISCECKCKFNGTKWNSNQWRNNKKCQCKCKKWSVFYVYIFNSITHFQFILSILICFIFVLRNGKCYFFNDIINIKNFDSNNIKIDEKPYKNILIYYIGYVSSKKYVNIYSVNPLYLIFRYINVYFEEINKNKYLMVVPTNESKEKIKKYEDLWIKIRRFD